MVAGTQNNHPENEKPVCEECFNSDHLEWSYGSHCSILKIT